MTGRNKFTAESCTVTPPLIHLNKWAETRITLYKGALLVLLQGLGRRVDPETAAGGGVVAFYAIWNGQVPVFVYDNLFAID